jgi:hypothetical protein
MTKDMAIAGCRRRRAAAEKAQIVRESLMVGRVWLRWRADMVLIPI